MRDTATLTAAYRRDLRKARGQVISTLTISDATTGFQRQARARGFRRPMLATDVTPARASARRRLWQS